MADNNYRAMMEQARENGGLLDGLLAAEAMDGYVSEAAIRAAAEVFDLTPASVYDTVSFYGMLDLAPKCTHEVMLCRGAACHVDGADHVRETLEKYLGISMGESTADHSCSLKYMGCQGLCGDGPVLMIDGTTYERVTAEKAVALLKKGGIQ